ncbi:hypothetical protein [Phaeovulum sp.]|uniref:hypothetical protein n=1 Tax=Phaeovulum sp. TaxID=2934796 RepID=UPI0035667E3D
MFNNRGAMRRSALIAASLAALAPVTLAAQGLEGTYAIGECGVPHDGVMTLAGATIMFFESACRLSNPTPLEGFDGALIYDASCAGEGETWKERMLIMPSFDAGLVVVSPGWANMYERCQ